MDNPFRFRNFSPDPRVEVYANTVLGQLTELVPAESTVLATLGKNVGKYVCKIRIFSHFGLFAAEIKDEDPIKTIKGAEGKIKEFISKWHMTRFSENKSTAKIS